MEAAPTRPGAQAWEWAAAGAILAIAGTLRALGASNNLWLDEIWTIDLARTLRSPLDILTLHHDNNHHLNTLWFYLLGENAPPLLYRLVSIVAGVLSVGVAGWIGRRRGTATGLLAMLLMASSYVLVLFGSEGRGYSVLALCALTAYAALDAFLERPRAQTAVLYAAAASLGLAAHATFVTVLAATGAWSAYRLAHSPGAAGRKTSSWLALHAVPLGVLAALYVLDLQYLEYGRGTATRSLIDVYGVSLAGALGTPRAAAAQLVLCIAAVSALFAGLTLLRRTGSDHWLFFAAVIIFFPVLTVVVREPEFVYVRYFLVSIVFLILLLAFGLGALWERGAAARVVSIAAVAAYVGVNGWSLADLARHGRGGYREALTYMGERTTNATVTIGGDHDVRVGFVIGYYAAHAALPKPVAYVEQNAWPPAGPDWLVAHRESTDPPRARSNEVFDAAGNRYELAATFPTANLSGLHWFVYRNTGQGRR